MLIQQSDSVIHVFFQILILQSPYHSMSTELNMGYVKDFFSCLQPINHCSFFFLQLYGGGNKGFGGRSLWAGSWGHWARNTCQVPASMAGVEKPQGKPSRGLAQPSFSLRCRETLPVTKHFPLPYFVLSQRQGKVVKEKTKKQKKKTLWSTNNMDSCFLSCMSSLYWKSDPIKYNPKGKRTKSVLGGPEAFCNFVGKETLGLESQNSLIIKTEGWGECWPVRGWGPWNIQIAGFHFYQQPPAKLSLCQQGRLTAGQDRPRPPPWGRGRWPYHRSAIPKCYLKTVLRHTFERSICSETSKGRWHGDPIKGSWFLFKGIKHYGSNYQLSFYWMWDSQFLWLPRGWFSGQQHTPHPCAPNPWVGCKGLAFPQGDGFPQSSLSLNDFHEELVPAPG